MIRVRDRNRGRVRVRDRVSFRDRDRRSEAINFGANSDRRSEPNTVPHYNTLGLRCPPISPNPISPNPNSPNGLGLEG